jgi:acyl carrier protein
MSDDIETKVSAYIAGTMLKQPDRTVDPQEKLISSGLIDSFHLVDLSLFVEDTFGVHLDDTELNAESFDTLAALAAIIRSRRKSA